jgi:hypothetical protein
MLAMQGPGYRLASLEACSADAVEVFLTIVGSPGLENDRVKAVLDHIAEQEFDSITDVVQ